MSFSHSGIEHLSHLVSRGRFVRLAMDAVRLHAQGTRWGTIAAQAYGPFLPHRVWTAIGRIRGQRWDINQYSAIRPGALERMGVADRAAQKGLDFSYRPMADGQAMRLWVLRRPDAGNYNKGMLGGWGLDCRDPTADQRLVEFCLRIPSREFLRGGMRGLARRALSDRLPNEVVGERRKGYQAADWHLGVSAHRDQLSREVERIAHCTPAAEILDVERLEALIRDLPESGWNQAGVSRKYRLALLRGLTAGHFLRKAGGHNF